MTQHLQFSGLWRHPNFLKLWAGQTISLLGSGITDLALPLTAVITLHAGTVQMGILTAVERAPFLGLSLFVGVWVDRYTPRPTLVIADLGRAILLASIPAAALLGVLRIEYLYLVALPVGILTVFFDVAYYSFLPALVRREQLVEGNSKLSVTESMASIASPGLAGALVQLLSAPTAILADALSFLVSVASLLLIRMPETASEGSGIREGMWREIGQGLGAVFKNPLLRPITACGATHNLTSSMLLALYVLYLSRHLDLAPTTIGFVFAAGSVGSLLGALLGRRVATHFGIGHALAGAQLLTAFAYAFFPLAGGPTRLVIVLLVTGQLLWGISRPIFNITQVSLRQTVTPAHLLGRMTASMRFITWGVMPIGALIGGALGAAIGIRPTLFVIVVGEILAALWVIFSPLRGMADAPSSTDQPSAARA